MSPQERAKTEQQTPHPLFQRQAFGAERVLAVLDDKHLRQDRTNPYAVENRVGEEPLEHVALPVYFSGVDLIEQRHHDERVENDGEMLRRLRAELGTAARRYV